ncbi:MAG: TetR/AcrR family transcriptional regulator [Myxococcales bacterium]|nr:TetR/AcrR family transcriptional regulator [Myxococcales bacterium]
MFTKNRKSPARRKVAKPRGRPRGETAQGREARQRLYETALRLFAARGYEATTLRDIAKEAEVSPGLLYRYFDSKQAVVMALYDQLSSRYADEASSMGPGPWRERFVFAMGCSLAVLGPERASLGALVGVLVGDPRQGLFASETASSRERVRQAFERAVTQAADAPAGEVAAALGRLLYLAHLALLLFWLLDQSPEQRATSRLLDKVEEALPWLSAAIASGLADHLILDTDEITREALFA